MIFPAERAPARIITTTLITMLTGATKMGFSERKWMGKGRAKCNSLCAYALLVLCRSTSSILILTCHVVYICMFYMFLSIVTEKRQLATQAAEMDAILFSNIQSEENTKYYLCFCCNFRGCAQGFKGCKPSVVANDTLALPCAFALALALSK